MEENGVNTEGQRRKEPATVGENASKRLFLRFLGTMDRVAVSANKLEEKGKLSPDQIKQEEGKLKLALTERNVMFLVINKTCPEIQEEWWHRGMEETLQKDLVSREEVRLAGPGRVEAARRVAGVVRDYRVAGEGYMNGIIVTYNSEHFSCQDVEDVGLDVIEELLRDMNTPEAMAARDLAEIDKMPQGEKTAIKRRIFGL